MRWFGAPKSSKSLAVGGSGRAPATARYLRGESAGILSAWRPALRSSNDDVKAAWADVAAKTIDACQNRGWLSGAVDQGVGDAVGVGLLLNATPDGDALGWSSDETYAWSRLVERRYRIWSNNPLECDARGKQTVGAMTASAVRYYYFFGESTSRTLLRDRPGCTTKTKIQLLSPHRLSQDSSDFENLHQGVFLDPDGMPIGYRFKTRRNGFDETLNIRARDADGRPLVTHVFDGLPDQVRGISPMAPALKVARQYDQLADATLTTTLMQTIFAATLESATPSGEALEGLLTEADGATADVGAPGGMAAYMAQRADWYSGAGIDLGTHGRINTTFPGDSLKFHSTQHPHSNYLPFSGDLKRELARAAGVTVESMTGDYQGATFSSLKMGVATIWTIVLRRRQRIAVPFVQSVYDAWLEEEVATGRIPFAGGYANFLRNRAAATQATWRGPAKPTADELKTAKALRELKDGGFYSLSTGSAELGIDWETELDQKAQESAAYRAKGLPDPHAAPQASRIGLDDPDLIEGAPNGGVA